MHYKFNSAWSMSAPRVLQPSHKAVSFSYLDHSQTETCPMPDIYKKNGVKSTI